MSQSNSKWQKSRSMPPQDVSLKVTTHTKKKKTFLDLTTQFPWKCPGRFKAIYFGVLCASVEKLPQVIKIAFLYLLRKFHWICSEGLKNHKNRVFSPIKVVSVKMPRRGQRHLFHGVCTQLSQSNYNWQKSRIWTSSGSFRIYAQEASKLLK